MGRHKSHDKPQVFDVSKPGRSTPSPTSRPIIVNHRPVADATMLANSNPETVSHTTKSVVPIEVSAHEADTSETPAKDEHNNPSMPAGLDLSDIQAPLTPSAPVEPTAGAVGPISGSQASATDSSPADNPSVAAESTAPPELGALPAELAAPEADDPVGLSNPNSSDQAPQPAINIGFDSSVQPPPGSSVEHNSPETGLASASEAQKSAEQLPAVPDNIGEIEAIPFPAHSHYGHYVQEARPKKWLIPSFILLLVGAFLVLDAGIIGSGKLPFEIFKEQEEAVAEEVTASSPIKVAPPQQTPNPQPASTVSQYRLGGTPLGFAYPTAWGNPMAVAEPGFSKRGGNNKSDGTYTHLITFETNKDIQIALTSSKYLPPTRPALYYDYLQWCVGTHDNKYYWQKLLFSTASGVDSPTTIACSEGPLADISKLDDATILQANAKDSANKPVGDIYTKNLADKEFIVLRVKDASRANGDTVKALLTSVKLTAQP